MQLDASNFSDSGDYDTEEADQSVHGSTWNVDEHFDFQTFHEQSENEQDKSDESPKTPVMEVCQLLTACAFGWR